MSDEKKLDRKRYAKQGRPVKTSLLAVQHGHNCWEIVRSTLNVYTVRCRECQLLAKVREIKRCHAFNTENGCPKGGACGEDHIHSHKMKLEERLERHGHSILKRVPWASLPPPPLLEEDVESSSC